MSEIKEPTEDELRELLRGLRPDPEEFRARVLERIAQREALQSSMSQAASMLPLGWLAGGSAQALPVAHAWTGSKLVSSLLTLPVVSLAMAGLAFLHGLRAVVGLRNPTASRVADAEALVKEWWQEHAVHAQVTLGLMLVLAFVQPIEALVLVLLASLVHVSLILSKLGRVGAASRLSVGAFTASFLGLLVLAALFVGRFAEGLRLRDLPEAWVPLVLTVGCMACGFLSEWQSSDLLRRKLLRVVLPLGATLLVAGWAAVRARPLDDARIATWYAGFERPLSDPIAWRAAGAAGAWLEEPEDQRPRGVFEAAWRDRDRRPADPSEKHVLSAALRAGLLPEPWVEALRTEATTLDLLLSEDPLRFPEALQLELLALASSPLEGEIRDRLAQRLRAGWPALQAPRAFETIAIIHELREALQRPLPVDELRDDVHSMLLARYRGTHLDGDRPAGFTDSQNSPETRGLAPILQVEATHRAIRLMASFGVPEGVDIGRVERFLRQTASPSLVECLAPRSFRMLTVQPYRYHAAVALFELRHSGLLDGDPPSTLRRLVTERVLVLSALLVLLCLVATLRAPDLSIDPIRS